jgi:RNase P/RNase MRP subunit p30
VEIGLFFSELLNANPFNCSRWLRNAFFLAKLAKKTKTRFSVFSGAHSFEESRSEKDLQAVADFLNNPV